ncbi:MAG: hypothetical protein RLZZ23_1316 [Verrucomicrobiota bacterium]
MFKKFNLTDRLLFIAVFLVIIFSKLLYLSDYKLEAIFVGLWAPSILVPYFAVFIFILFGIAFFAAMQRFKKMNADDRAEGLKKPGA